jgi:hypothetical protein
MLERYEHYGAVFVEITRGAHERGGPGWDFGTCLWIPTRNAAGADRYALMRQVSPGNLVLHINARDWDAKGVSESRLCGASRVASSATETKEAPPIPGEWRDRAPYYRVDLNDYIAFRRPLKTRTLTRIYCLDLRREILEVRPRFYPFNTYGDGVRLVQGIYLAKCTPGLYELFSRALKIEAATEGKDATDTSSTLRGAG